MKKRINPRSGVDSNTGFIYLDKLKDFVGNSFHYGVQVGNKAYDNLTTMGLEFTKWLTDLGANGSFADITYDFVNKILNYQIRP